jgi:hypothetical protein
MVSYKIVVPRRRTVLVVIVVVELADASCALRQLRAGTVGVADAIYFLTVTVEALVASTSGIHHWLANSATLRWDVVVVELLCRNSANGNKAEEYKAVLVLHSGVE